MSNKFAGYYYKHHNGEKTVAFIPGISADGAFIQVITDDRSYNFPLPSITMGSIVEAEGCRFSTKGMEINLPPINGKIKYSGITPLQSDIMGIFKYFPMECRHGVVSMRHRLDGYLNIDGQTIDFTDGTGYIEKDSGRSFPSSYTWLQCNDFADQTSIMVSLAVIPFMGMHFNGCICAIIFDGKEYRLATYKGVKAQATANSIKLNQGIYRLEIDIENNHKGHALASPVLGKMSGIVHENNHAHARFRFFVRDKLLFDKTSNHVSFERFNN